MNEKQVVQIRERDTMMKGNGTKARGGILVRNRSDKDRQRMSGATMRQRLLSGKTKSKRQSC